ncbi:MAG: DUF1365 domain-containing protein [Pseudomonadota bacterium]
MSLTASFPTEPQHLATDVFHLRKGALHHRFSYRADYVLLEPGRREGPRLLSYDRFNLASFHTRDHGGPRGAGRGAAWVCDLLKEAGLPPHDARRLLLLTQVRALGYWFTPVSFWLVLNGDDLVAIVAEVNNTFGDRHSYLCHNPDFTPIAAQDEFTANKVFHVSPFRDIVGDYRFQFSVSAEKISIRIAHRGGEDRFLASMTGRPVPLRNRHLIGAALRRPLGPIRVLTLIYWNALRLKLKGAAYRPRPEPPEQEVTT